MAVAGLTVLCAPAGLSNTGIPQVQQELNAELDDVRSEASLSQQAADTAPHFFWTQILQTLEGIARPVAAESVGPRHAGHSSVSSSRCAAVALVCLQVLRSERGGARLALWQSFADAEPCSRCQITKDHVPGWIHA